MRDTMKRTVISRSAHRLAVAAVAGAAVLAPMAAMADDATSQETELAPGQQAGSTEEQPTEQVAEPTPELPDEQVPDEQTPDEQVPDEQTPDEQVPDEQAPDEQTPDEQVTGEADEEVVDDEGTEAAPVDEVIEPDFGLGKYSQPVRVGSSLADGTYVPDGITTAGTVLRVVETGPLVEEEGNRKVTECTTEADTATEGSTATFCVFEDQPVPEPAPRIGPLSIVYPENPDIEQDDQVYLAERGSTVTVETVSVPEGLVADPEPAVVDPCPELPDNRPVPLPDEDYCTRQVALVEATGLPPVAADDAATTQQDTPVTIDVLANDDSVAGAPVTDVDVAAPPQHGTVQRVGTGAETRFVYTPEDGFSGTDVFGYGFVTPNGVAFADVTVEVVADPVIDEDDTIVPISDDRGTLPDAGGPSQGLLGLGGALVALGAAAVALGRRRTAQRS